MNRRGSKNDSPVATRSSSLTFDLFKEGLENLKKELKNDFFQFKKEFKQEITKSMETIAEQMIAPLQEKIEIQEKELEVLRKAVINRERNILREERIKLSTSLVISGIKESRNEKPSETRKIVEDLLNSVESEVEVLSAERVGRFDGKYPRLIKIKTEDKKKRVFF